MTNDPEHALPRRGYLGFSVDACPAPLEFLHEGPERWIVSEVDAPSAGESAEGLARGDDLISINDARICTLADLRAEAASVPPGSTARVGVLRDKKLREIVVRARAMPLENLHAGLVELDHVAWQYGGQDYRLRAIWTSPSEHPPTAAVWLLPSAAWITQECPLDPLDPTFQLVDSLTAQGVATLRIDRSGLGDSEGPHASTLDFEAEISMWQAGRRYFVEKTPGLRRCLWGRSLGGMLAPLIAESGGIDAICVLNSSSLAWHEAMLESIEHQNHIRGRSREDVMTLLKKVEALQRLVYLEGLTPTEARRRNPDLAEVETHDYVGNTAFGRDSAFFQQMQEVDLEESWSRFSGEVLALHAEHDIIVPERAVLRLAEAAGKRCRFLSLKGVDHFMHERASLKEAVDHPWGGTFSQPTARVMGQFLSGNRRAR